MKNKKQSEKEILEKIKKVAGAMAQEGMPLTKDKNFMIVQLVSLPLKQNVKKIIGKYQKI